MSVKTVLALDLSSKTGWAFTTVLPGISQLLGNSGVLELTGSRIDRAVQFRRWLEQKREQTAPEIVIYERPFARGAAATRSLWGMAGIVEATFGDQAAVLDAEVNTLKKWAAARRGPGKPSLGKADALAVARTLLGRAPIDDNEADAVCLAWYTAEKLEVE